MENQTKRIKAHLDSGESITALDAFEIFSCLRLAARMHDLKESGYPFMKETITYNNGKRVAMYTKVNLQYNGDYTRGLSGKRTLRNGKT